MRSMFCGIALLGGLFIRHSCTVAAWRSYESLNHASFDHSTMVDEACRRLRQSGLRAHHLVVLRHACLPCVSKNC